MKTLATVIAVLTVGALTACNSVAAAPAPPNAASAQQPAAAGGDQQEGGQARRQGAQGGQGGQLGQGRQANGGGSADGQGVPGGRGNRQGGSEPQGGPAAGQSQGQAGAGGFAGARVEGVVAKVDGDMVTLATGATFKLDPQARVTRTIKKTADDLKAGQFVAITGSGQPDNSILATQIAVFGDSFRAQNGGGQRQLPTGDLMTNANIESINGFTLQVSFPGGKARVVLVANVEVVTRELGAAADIQPGATVTTSVPADGAARVVNVQ